jgi:opacity protein-like surface antigen
MKIFSAAILSLALLAPGLAKAAEVNATDGKVAFGLQGGLLFPKYNVSGSTLSNTWDRKDGWKAGVFFEFGIWTVTLRPEVSYARKGYTVGSFADVTSDNLQLAALLKFSPFGDGVFSPFILLGPQWSKQFSADTTRRAGSTALYVNTADTWDIAAVGGLGFEFNVSEHVALGLQGRYVYGFRDIDASTTEVKQREVEALANLTFQNAF